MMKKFKSLAVLSGCVAAFSLTPSIAPAADDTPITREQFLQLQKQNEQLQQQLQNQQQLIETLSHKVADIQNASEHHEPVTAASTATTSASTGDDLTAMGSSSSAFRIGKVDITGEGGIALFSSESHGQNPHPTFRIDEARLFLEAPVWEDTYFYSEIDVSSPSLGLYIGELYLDFEDVSKLWGRDRMLNIRVGQFYSPFGEEYQNRFAINNPLISHSVSDLWGADVGVEAYGKIGQVSYALALQDGGISAAPALQDDKAVVGRISYDPKKWLHTSLSGMRTGNMNVKNGTSAMWFASSFFAPLPGSKATTFGLNLVEADAQINLPQVKIKAAGGFMEYGDNDSTVSNHRNIFYYYLEGEHDFTRQFYVAARFSEVLAHNGYLTVGSGNTPKYGFTTLTDDYWRLSMGLGYRFTPNLLLKGEYSFNQGREANDAFRPGENAFALEAAFKF